MSISRRSLIGGLAAAPALTALTACGGSGGGSGTTEITYGYIPDFNGASLLAIADDKGLWEENGLEATLQTFTNGPLQIQALGTGDLDFGYIGPGAMWLPASGKAKVITVNGAGRRTASSPSPESTRRGARREEDRDPGGPAAT